MALVGHASIVSDLNGIYMSESCNECKRALKLSLNIKIQWEWLYLGEKIRGRSLEK